MNTIVKRILNEREYVKVPQFNKGTFKVWIGNQMIVTSNISNTLEMFGSRVTHMEKM